MTKRLPIILLLLTLLTGAAHGATYTVGTGGTHATFSALFTADSDWSGDSIAVLSDFTDGATVQQLHNSTSACKINLNGKTVTFNALSTDTSYVWRLNATTAGTVTITNGTIITNSNFLYMSKNVDVVMSGVTVTAGGRKDLVIITDVDASLTLTSCTLQFSAIGTRASTDRLIYVESVAAPLTATSTTFSTCGRGILYTALASAVTITNCAFVDCGEGAVIMTVGGSPTITGTTFTCQKDLGTFVWGNRRGVLLATPFGTACDAVIEGCTFNINGSYGLRIGTGTTADQGTGGRVTDCVFGPDSTYYQCYIEANGVEVSGCTWLGSRASSTHMLMLGADGGTSLDDAQRATGLLIHDNQWLISTAPRTDGAANFHNIVCKADGAKIYNNRFSFLTTITNEPGPNATQIYLKGADDCQIYNNDFYTVYAPVVPFKLGIQVANKCADNKFYNNKLLNASTYDMVISDKDEQGGLEVACNLMGTAGLKDNTTTPFTLKTDSTWFKASNFSDSTSWRMQWGARAGLTGITYSAQGFANVGINTTSQGQPTIGKGQPGFRYPVEALESIRSVGALKGVTLDMYAPDPQARANLKVWLFDEHPAASHGTYQSVAGDTLKIRKAFQ